MLEVVEEEAALDRLRVDASTTSTTRPSGCRTSGTAPSRPRCRCRPATCVWFVFGERNESDERQVAAVGTAAARIVHVAGPARFVNVIVCEPTGTAPVRDQ